MREQNYYLVFDEIERGIILRSLNELRNRLLSEGRCFMGKIFKYLKESWAAVLAIVLLLLVQAYCDLQLPQYTSGIVDIGIGQGGIAYAAPEKMREETYANLLLFMTEEERAAFPSPRIPPAQTALHGQKPATRSSLPFPQAPAP